MMLTLSDKKTNDGTVLVTDELQIFSKKYHYLYNNNPDDIDPNYLYELITNYVHHMDILGCLNSIDYQKFVTITYKYDFKNHELREYLKKFLHFLNKKVVGRNYEKKGNPLKGIISIEKTKQGRTHFHILFEKNSHIDSDRKEKSFWYSVKESAIQVRKNNISGNDSYRVTERSGVRILDVYDNEGVIQYVMKDILNIFDYNNLLTFVGDEVY